MDGFMWESVCVFEKGVTTSYRSQHFNENHRTGPLIGAVHWTWCWTADWKAAAEKCFSFTDFNRTLSVEIGQLLLDTEHVKSIFFILTMDQMKASLVETTENYRPALQSLSALQSLFWIIYSLSLLIDYFLSQDRTVGQFSTLKLW